MRHEKVVIIRNMFHPSDFEVPPHACSATTHTHTHTQLNDDINACARCTCADGLNRKTHWC